MTTTETRYSARFRGPHVLLNGADNPLSCPVYRSGQLIVAISGTLTITNASNVVVVSAAAITVVSGIATYTVLASALVGQVNTDGWLFDWDLTLTGGHSEPFRNDGVLAHRRLTPPVTDADLYGVYADLSRRLAANETSWQDALDEAWGRIESRLVSTGRRPWLILAGSALRDVHLHRTLEIVWRGLATGGSASAEWEQADKADDQFEACWGRLSFPTADPSTGANASPGRRKSATPTCWLAGRG